MNDHQLINQNSSDVEYYTPPEIIEAARLTMGGTIVLDPASSELANRRVGALRWYGHEADGYLQSWEADSVWLNHPFGRREDACAPDCKKDHVHHSFPLYGNKAWVEKQVREHDSGNAREICSITFAATSEAWFQPLLKRLQCFLSPRTNYLLPDGTVKKGVTKGSAVTYFGNEPGRFRAHFERLGTCK